MHRSSEGAEADRQAKEVQWERLEVFGVSGAGPSLKSHAAHALAWRDRPGSSPVFEPLVLASSTFFGEPFSDLVPSRNYDLLI